MAKSPPSFNLYPGDLIKSCIEMSATEFGAYMRLLCHQWEHGAIPKRADKLARICGLERSEFGEIWETVGLRFNDVEGENLKVQSRLAEQREKDIATWLARREGGNKGGRPVKGDDKTRGNRKPQGLGGGSQNKTSMERGKGKRKKSNSKKVEAVSADDISALPVPDSLASIDDFPDAWLAWIIHKQSSDKPWRTAGGAKAQLARLTKLDSGDLVAGIYNSISNDWEGIYLDRAAGSGNSRASRSTTFAQQRVSNSATAIKEFADG